MSSTTNFYNDLPILDLDANTLFRDLGDFNQIPDDWYILFTDVEGSTEFWKKGNYALVNKIASAGIDIVIRTAILHNISVPYVYGGDGIVACFPPELLREISYESIKLYHYAHNVCGANMRIGILPASDVSRRGYPLAIKRIGHASTISHTIFDDSAFSWVESEVKSNTRYGVESIVDKQSLDSVSYEQFVLPLWQELYSPHSDEFFLCLIIVPNDPDHLETYHEIVVRVERCMPSFFHSHPLVTMEKDGLFLVDFIKTDGSLKMILSGTESEISCLLAELGQMEQRGDINFGHVVSQSSIVTYIIQESDTVHAGLIDVRDGGYVAASHELKQKINRSRD